MRVPGKGQSAAAELTSEADNGGKGLAREEHADVELSLAGRAPSGTHLDTSSTVLLRFETLSDRAVKNLILLVWAVVGTGVALLVCAVWLQASQEDTFFFSNRILPSVNVGFASVCTALVASFLAFFVARLLRVRASRKRWSHRRRRLAGMACTELSIQLVSCTMFLASNAYVLSKDCAWFDSFIGAAAFVRWTSWNSLYLLYLIEAHSANPLPEGSGWRAAQREPGEHGAAAVMDAPLRLHWKKLLVWGVLEANYIALTVLVEVFLAGMKMPPPPQCRDMQFQCRGSSAVTVLTAVQVGLNLAYFCLFGWLLWRSYNHLLRLPYEQHRQANFIVRLWVRLRGLSVLFFILSVVIYTLIGLGTCMSYVLSWLGFLPIQLVSTLTVCINGWLMTPIPPGEQAILRAWLQEFAFTEEEVPRRRRQRASSLPPGSQAAAAVDSEPMFCVETGLKCLFWSTTCYDHEEVPDSAYTLKDSLALYDLQSSEVMYEPVMDTKCLIGWSSDRVVIAFRGTASLANVKADLQMWRTRWPPRKGRVLLRTAPMVHKGFLKAWTANGLNERLLVFLGGLLEEAGEKQKGGKPVDVIVTGHSLGGALAMLCAFEIARRFDGSKISLQCYTYGAPRPGNHAFAWRYNKVVPQTWHVINDEDMVVKGGKFFRLYKRPGLRVLINRLGDLVVRPSHAEQVVRTLPGASSIRDHLLTSYSASLAAVLGTQFSSKSFHQGREGVLRLVEQRGASVVLGAVGLTHEALDVLRHKGWDGLLQARRAAEQARRRASWSPDRLAWLPRKKSGDSAAGSQQLSGVLVLEEGKSEEAAEKAGQPAGEVALAGGAAAGRAAAAAAVAAASADGTPPAAAGGPAVAAAASRRTASLAAQPSAARRLLSRASTLGSRRDRQLQQAERRLGPSMSVRGPVGLEGLFAVGEGGQDLLGEA